MRRTAEKIKKYNAEETSNREAERKNFVNRSMARGWRKNTNLHLKDLSLFTFSYAVST